ncbi:ketopantoate reductase family protein [Nocardioides plantarum]|uniref:2-dehydropantoate 2-reductase n=1 Tax=Nocardioides plantarum TaxID=29299 RepID=A0ABV5K903_9ACTN|nr:2-dehydropantoate 2-reductase [Nocardioides plantarum]
MRYVVLGAGAVGGGVGGLLHRAGLPITLVARGSHLAALRADGLRLRVGREPERTWPVPAVGAPSEVDWTDDTVVLLAVKSQQTAAALADLLPHLPPEVPLVSLQNGVSNERTLLRHVEHVHAITVMMPASHLEPGLVTIHSAGTPALLDIGRYPDGLDDVDHAVAADLRAAGMASEPRADIMAWKHRKLLMNLGNAVDAACVPGEDAATLVDRLRLEGERVLAEARIAVTSAADDQDRRGELLRPLVDRDAVGSSSWQSVSRRTGDVETDHLNGEIVLLGRLHGVPTPANELVRRTLNDLVRRRGRPRTVSAAELLRRLDDATETHEGPATSR